MIIFIYDERVKLITTIQSKYLVWSRKNGRLHKSQVEGYPDEQKNTDEIIADNIHFISFGFYKASSSGFSSCFF